VTLETPHTINGSKTYNPTISGTTDKIITSPGTLDLKIDLDGGDNTPLRITNVRTGIITDKTAEILWDTDEPSDSLVDYGESVALGDSEFDPVIVTEILHSVTLTGLNPETLHHYEVTSCDPSANCDTSAQFSFTTEVEGEDVTPPEITNVRTESVTFTTANVLWDTDEDSDSLVEYGTTQTLDLQKDSSNMVTAHTLGLTELIPSTLYYYRVTSCDDSNNCDTSTPQKNFQTQAATQTPLHYHRRNSRRR
jgi:hypothetical protein